jgi:hypothetical protein
VLNVPAEQLVNHGLACAHHAPDGHTMQASPDVAPDVGLYKPAAHARAAVIPLLPHHEPGEQSTHADWPVSPLKVPIGHGSNSVLAERQKLPTLKRIDNAHTHTHTQKYGINRNSRKCKSTVTPKRLIFKRTGMADTTGPMCH